MHTHTLAIIANGEVRDYAQTATWLRDVDYILACDGGLRHLAAMDIAPHCLLGALDSAPAALVDSYRAQGIPLATFPAQKDETDLALAITHALTRQPSSILIIGALGGRIDHALANFHALAPATAAGVLCEIRDETTRAMLLGPGLPTLHLPRENSHTLSLIPLTTQVAGITTHGLTYPLQNETLHAGLTRGVSNTFQENTATITIENGLLAVICTAQPQGG